MRKSGGNKRRWMSATAAVLLALVLVCSVVLIIFSSISSASSRYTTSESYTGTVIAGGHDHSSWTDLNATITPTTPANDGNIYTLTTAGNYYLSDNLNGDLEIEVNGDDGEVTLCLNGFMITGTGTNAGTSTSDYNYGSVIMLGNTSNSTLTTNYSPIFNLYDCGGDTLTEHYYKCETEQITYQQNTNIGQENALTAVYYDFSVTDEDVSKIKDGTLDGGYVEGGVITGGRTGSTNCGGGVSIENESTFNMYGGTIAGNTTDTHGAAGVFVYGGTFNMYGGTIEGNCSTYHSSDYNRYGGGGVAVADGSSFTMADGVISNNYSLDGGGVQVDAINGDVSFKMQGGSITGNHACVGGGISEYGATGHEASVVISGGTIENNTAEGYFTQGTTKEADGTYIPSGEYSANLGYGGGVYVTNPGAKFKMSGGTITGNTQTNPQSGYDGAGLYLGNCAEGGFVLSGDAYIYGNYKYEIERESGALLSTVACNLGYNSNFSTDNSNNYPKKQIVLESALTSDALIGITFNGAAPAADVPLKFTYADTSTDHLAVLQASVGRFSSDEGYGIRVNTEGGYLEFYLLDE